MPGNPSRCRPTSRLIRRTRRPDEIAILFVPATLYGQAMTPRPVLALAAAVLVGLAGPAAAGAHAAAPKPYSATLRTAVRELPVAAEANAGYNRGETSATAVTPIFP